MMTQNSKLTEATPVEYPDRGLHLLAHLHYGCGERICVLKNYNGASILKTKRIWLFIEHKKKKLAVFDNVSFSFKIKK